VEESLREEARQCLREFSSDVYKIVDPWQSSYKREMDRGMGGQQIQMELCPGGRICNTRSRQCFLFSGSVINRELGITVAHALDLGDEIEIQFESDRAAAAHEKIVGRCRETFDTLQRQDGTMLTADLALLELNTERCSVTNEVCWPQRPSKALQLKIYKERRIPDDTNVIILDQRGHFQKGRIKTGSLTDGGSGLYDVLGIGKENEEGSATQPGDSGALVMSLPNSENDVIYVYGIVLGTCTTHNGKSSFTIANSLWKVIHEISTSEQYTGKLAIDFA